MSKNKLILDVCCGSKMFWFDKDNPNVLFMDKRKETLTAKDSSSKKGYRTINISPDVVGDFTDLPFNNAAFKMVVFDPPHMKSLGENSWMAKKYGKLSPTWKENLKRGFEECFRVLESNGVLIFKWNETEIKVSTILDLVDYNPLFGHKSGKRSNTHWISFMKLNKT